MREIKFRAWDKLDGKMYHTVETIDFKDGVDMRDDKGKGCFRMFENVDLMQYTGLKDKNGKEIYEGDIVEYDGTDKGWATTLNNGRYKVRIDAVKGIELVGYYEPSYVHLDGFFGNFEVIGNIYEQPNLLPIQPKK